jgi:hypothetical protein
MLRIHRLLLALGVLCNSVTCAIYEVGPGKVHPSISSVYTAAGNKLLPGDQIWIYYKPEPYYEKFVIYNKGTASSPIVIKGIPDPITGKLPIIDGTNAATPRSIEYWNQPRSLLKIGGATTSIDAPAFIRIESLQFRRARIGNTFTNSMGNTETYQLNCACILIEAGTNITIRNTELTECGIGFYVQKQSSNILDR